MLASNARHEVLARSPRFRCPSWAWCPPRPAKPINPTHGTHLGHFLHPRLADKTAAFAASNRAKTAQQPSRSPLPVSHLSLP